MLVARVRAVRSLPEEPAAEADRHRLAGAMNLVVALLIFLKQEYEDKMSTHAFAVDPEMTMKRYTRRRN